MEPRTEVLVPLRLAQIRTYLESLLLGRLLLEDWTRELESHGAAPTPHPPYKEAEAQHVHQ